MRAARPIASLALAGLLFAHPCGADPLHPVADGAWWHHDSGWIFPERIGEFVRVGVPQDIAGAPDAVAHYARVVGSTRTTASVDVFPSDSAAEEATLEGARAAIEGARAAIERGATSKAQSRAESPFPVGGAAGLEGTRVIYAAEGASVIGLYFVAAGEWRVRIRLTVPAAEADTTAIMDAFARDQRWATLASP